MDELLCELCQTPVPWTMRRRKGKASRYCCSGCLHVAEILKVIPEEEGQKTLEQARRMGIIPAEPGEALPAAPGPEPAPPDQAVRSERFLVEGLGCPSCAWLVSTVLQRQPGVLKADADFMSDSVRVSYDMRRTGPDEMSKPVGSLGYQLRLLGEGVSPEEVGFSRLLRRFVFSLFLSLNIMMLSAVHWASYLGAIPRVDINTIAIIQLILTLPLMALGVWPLLARSLRLVSVGRLSMDLLFVLGFSAAFGLSLYAFFSPSHKAHFYFDACGAFIAISLFGRLIEGRLRLRAARELRGLLEISATKVALDSDGANSYLPVEKVQPGDRIRIEPGHYVAFDGICASLVCAVSEAMLTGEPTPVVKHQGDEILAGSVALGESLSLQVTRPYHQGRLQQIADSIAQMLMRTEARLRSADRLASWFVPFVLLAATGTLLARLGQAGSSEDAWLPAISVLLVACPCAFGIASASALAAAVSALLKRGVLVKDAQALEHLGHIDLLLFDKTGTLTHGVWQLQELRWFGEPDETLLQAVAGAQAEIEHPVAFALHHELIHNRELTPLRPDQVEVLSGRGITARFGERQLRCGSQSLFSRVPQTDEIDDRTTTVYFGFDGSTQGCFLLTDEVREEAAGVIRFFQGQGIECRILSGDRQEVVDSIGRSLGLPNGLGGLSEAEKREKVEAFVRAGRRVAFAGDGSNDAPAMASSQTAIALRHGTQLALSTAHILPLGGALEVLPDLYRAARLTRATMRQNFGWAFGFNLVFLPLAALGYLHPIFAALLMLASSTTVLVNSLRLGQRIRPKQIDSRRSASHTLPGRQAPKET